ncbi:galactoside 2-alpha-L-fucosyltransferase 2 [Eurytemora carolleeae]|uniref:galactoside 2-alpha-L-fucosyltransferase 2 n=1 Tax=Eurytemora carolleeae TaxID=1294199 RepID=UPI000C7651D7|nr:galactoside 2-alpha-L-fucosyltransferase 2 [Eurytemora carolleeae]|eukprot:XP_023333790.1 galactoside 2-alpha-L-fucosyltransferase 2-like [Eurytemora affinis]
MNWMKRRYKNSVFLVASDDMKWCEEYLSQPGVHMVGGNSAALDFAILAKCNHSIVDYGSYSLWSAFLAGGNVITSADHQGAARSAGEMLGWKLWKFDFEN